MGLLERLIWKRPLLPEHLQLPGRDPAESQRALSEVPVRYEETPGTLDLGWYWSENEQEVQMAKVAQEDRATHCYVAGASGSGKTKFLV